jgi:hypothetical protein
MKYSKKFEEDYNLYFRLKDIFNFSPFDVLKGRKPIPNIKNYSAKEAFFYLDSQGKLYDTPEMDLLIQLLICKASINFHIKMYAQTRAEETLSFKELKEIQREYRLPPWFVEAVEKQKQKYNTPVLTSL